MSLLGPLPGMNPTRSMRRSPSSVSATATSSTRPGRPPWLTERRAMLLIVCPYCGRRPEIEFTYGGQAHLTRPAQPSQLDDQAWAEFLYMRSNTKGVYAERWRHARGCGRFFNALRDT